MLVTKERLQGIFVAMLVSMLFCSVGLAAEEAGTDVVTVEGVVSVVRDANDQITSVQLAAKDGTVYQITLDDKGIALGDEMEGEEAQVHGKVSEKDGAKWLTVLSFKAAKEEKEQ